MLKTLLGQSRHNPNTLRLYIVAASFPKMLHRMKIRLSEHYFDCLNGIESGTFGFTEPPCIATKKPNDQHPDQNFLDFLPGLRSAANIPKLLSVREKCMGIGTHEIYNKETYTEFHNLLCKVFLHFRESLKNLEATQLAAIEAGLLDVERVKIQLLDVLATGQSFRAMVTGNAIDNHLQNIEHLLVVDDGMLWKVAADSEEGDAEFDALKPFSMYLGKPLLPRQSYKNWLRLMVIYFDAEFDFVTTFSKSPTKSTSRFWPLPAQLKICSPGRICYIIKPTSQNCLITMGNNRRSKNSSLFLPLVTRTWRRVA